MSSWDFGGGSASGGGWDEAPASPAPVSSDWGSSGGSTPSSDDGRGGIASAPVVWLGLGGLAALCSLGVGLVSSSPKVAAVAWLLGGPVAIGLLAVFVSKDTVRRAEPFYAVSFVAEWGRRLLVVLALVAVAVNAWTIADFVARGGSW